MSKAELDKVLRRLRATVKEILLPVEGSVPTRKWESTSSFAEVVRGSFGRNESLQHIASLLAMAEHLLDQSFDESDAPRLQQWHTRWYARAGDAVQMSPGAIENTYVKNLTAVWLGLYFLGVPFWHPWERVRQWEDEKGGGLPSGACVAKAIGDIVRSARMRCVRKPATERCPLIILSGWPILLFEDLMIDGPDKQGIEDDACILGRYYEFLQLLLYCRPRPGYPVYYYITEEVIARKLGIRNATAVNKDVVLKQWNLACEWLRDSVFNGERDDNQAVYVLDEPKTPPCFINHAEGLFTFEQFKGAQMAELPLSAGYMREVRRALYVQTFESEQRDKTWRNILVPDASNTLFETLWQRFNCQPE
ncbi:hypothetical protein IQ288_34675 [Burkholderia sp. R-69980]|jgi:hypothetical protein|nr:hypothetical protein [Burkholderia sp. R-69980]